MKLPLVSIIIPNYNRAELIGETLDSILAQTYTHWECIVVDDGSTDRSESVIRDYCKKDDRISFYHRPDERPKGANACRNYGFELSAGKYVNWLDSDDLFGEEKLMKQIEALESNELQFSVCQSFIFKNSIENIVGLKSEDIYLNNPFDSFLRRKIIIPVQGPIFKKDFLLKNNYKFDESLQAGQEWEFLARILFKNPEYHHIQEPLDYIRSHAENISNHVSKEKYWHYFLARFRLYNDYKEEFTNNNLISFNLFFLFIFKLFVRLGEFSKALFIWKKCLLSVKELNLIDHIRLLSGLISYRIVKKGDFFLSKVSLYRKLDDNNSNETMIR